MESDSEKQKQQDKNEGEHVRNRGINKIIALCGIAIAYMCVSVLTSWLWFDEYLRCGEEEERLTGITQGCPPPARSETNLKTWLGKSPGNWKLEFSNLGPRKILI